MKNIWIKSIVVSVAALVSGLSTACFGQRPIEFQHLSINEGLSQSIVFCITQDQDGYMWFGTEDGLNRYDGYEFTIFRNEQGDTNSVSNNGFVSNFVDSKGLVWLGTYGGGLNRLDPKTGTITRFRPRGPGTKTSKGLGLGATFMFAIYEDTTGILWIGAHNNLNRYDPATESFVHYRHNPKDPASAPGGATRSVLEDKNGNLWLGSQGKIGLSRFDRDTEEFIHYPHDEDDPESLSSNDVIAMFLDSKEHLWIGTYGGGLNRVDLSNFDADTSVLKFDHFRHDPNDPFSLSKDHIAAIREDSRGNLWIGTHNGGLNRLDRKTGKFHRYLHDPLMENSLSDNTVYSIYEDDFGVLWFGTREGINKYSPLSDKFITYRHNPHDSSSLSSNHVRGIATDDDGAAWIGTSGGGLNRLDLSTGTFTHYTHDPNDPRSLQNNSIRALLKDRHGKIWIGADGTGLCLYDPVEDSFTTHSKYAMECKGCLGGNRIKTFFEDMSGNIWIGSDGRLAYIDVKSDSLISFKSMMNDESSISSSSISAMCQTSDGVMWIGTTKWGFNKYNPADNTFKRYMSDPEDSASLPDARVRCIMQAKDGTMWIGTLGGGLIKFNPDSETFENWRMPDQSRSSQEKKDGLPNDIVYAILEDDHGNLWISTNKGISKFNPLNESFRNYDVSDGLQSNEFSTGAYHKSANGLMFFGGIEGINVFHPDSIADNEIPPRMVIGKFSVFNREVIHGEDLESRLTKPINYTDTLFLSYKDYVFSFEFAALHFGIPEKNQYAYQMVGFEKDWNYVGRRRFATYTNLDPGSYTFRVKGSNSDGVWNEEGKSVYIIISPPFWQTWWFRVLSFIAVVAGIIIYIKLREAALKRQRRVLRERVRIKTKQLRRQKEEIEEKNRDITDSIEYASNIQNAILPKKEEMEKALTDHFVFFAPRDIVSGDFYWFAEKRNKIFIAACDCTGHGVPGAFLSMIGNDLLNQLIIEQDIDDPAEILKQLSNGIKSVFTRKGSKQEAKDGMDMVLVVFDAKLSKMQCAGAQNSIFIFRKSEGGGSKMEEGSDGLFTMNLDEQTRGYMYREIKGDRTPIGGRTELDFKFTNHQVELKKEDAIYLFSDGFMDQFGGLKEKKFTKKRFLEMLLRIQIMPMDEQKKTIEKRFLEWQGDFEQIDDVLVVGIKT